MNDSRPPQAKRRWHRLTPDRFLMALLPIVGLLWLSERFRWFAFNEHKNWTVLIALAVVCVAVVTLLLWFGVSLVLRRRFQFSIRSLLVLTVVVAIPCSWLAMEMNKARKQREVVEGVEKLGGAVSYGYQTGEYAIYYPGPPILEWPSSLLGEDFFSDVVAVSYQNSTLWNDAFDRVRELQSVTDLTLHGRQITDSELEQLSGLTRLRVLTLNATSVTDASVRHLNGLKNLRYLGFDFSPVTGESLGDLECLEDLVSLELPGTQVRDRQLRHLEQSSDLCSLNLSETEVTDAGLRHLEGMTGLAILDLGSTQVTDAGLVHLRGLTNLWNLSLSGTEITDAGLEHLDELANLAYLSLDRTQVTDEGISKLQQALPNCKISR